MSKKYLRTEMIICFIACFGLTSISIASMSLGSPWSDIAWFAAVFGLIGIPLIAVRHFRRHEEDKDELVAGTAIVWGWKDFLMGFACVLILLFPVALGNHFVRTDLQGLTFQFNWAHYTRLESPLYYEFLIQILCVALPEEFFYRGYLQTNLQTYFQKHTQFKKWAPILAITLASACFAVTHLPSGGAVRLLTFFPGLLFGFLRYKSGGLCGAIFCHAMCNLMMLILNVHYF